METTFVQALRGEASVAERSHSGAFLWDLANYYEYVDHEALWQRAVRRGFPLPLLAVSLNQARARRFMGFGDVAVDAQYPRRGLAAGDGFATTFVQIYALDPLESGAPDILMSACRCSSTTSSATPPLQKST